jgi:Zn-finger nucleic acid-binding protein
MSFQWLQMRIQEERERRQREAQILEALPHTLEEVHGALTECVKSYTEVFGAESADIVLLHSKIKVTIHEPGDGRWHSTSKVEIGLAPAVPGLQIDRGEVSTMIEVGLLPGKKIYYRDRERDKYLTMEELTRRILDRAFFPRLPEE